MGDSFDQRTGNQMPTRTRAIQNRAYVADPSMRHRIVHSVLSVLGPDGRP